MSEDNETIEDTDTEMSVDDVRQDAIRTMMSQWQDGKLSDAQDTFSNMMNVRADDAVAARKSEMAASVYSNPEGEGPVDVEGWPEPPIGEPEEAEENEEV